jgi:hypothetical protein
MRLGMGLGLGNLLSGQPLTGFPNDFSFNFDGNGDYLDCGASNVLVTGTNVTLSCWFKVDGTSRGYLIQNQKGAGSTNLTIQVNSNDSSETAGYVGAIIWSGAGHDFISVDGSVDDGAWHHLALTTTSSAQVLYLDGTSVATGSGTFTNASSTDSTLIGNDGGSNYDFDGLIDEVAIWDTVLSASDIAKIASKPVDFSKASTYATDRTANLKLWLRAGDKVLPEEDASIARSDFYTDFDSSNTLVNCGDDTSFDMTTSYTLMGWVNLTAITSATQFLFGRDDGTNRNYWIEITNSNGYVSSVNLGTSDTSTVGSACPVGVWTHICSSYDGANVKVYINGKLDVSESVTGTLDNDDVSFTIGARDSADRAFGGGISNVSLYKTALDAQTISQMAKSRFTPMRDNRFSVVDFSSSNDRIEISNNSALSFGTNVHTISAWAKLDVLANYKTIISKRQASGTVTDYNLSVGANGVVYTYNGSAVGQTATGVISAGSWFHYALVYSGSAYQLYINGSAVAWASGTTTSGASNSHDIGIGWDRTGNYWEGSISSVSLYNVAKSAEEIYAQYSKGITHNPSADTGLVGLWRMGSDASKAYPTIADSSSNSNDGTITNGASDDIVQQMVAGYDMGAFESTGEELGAELASGGSWYDGGVSGVTTSKDGITSTVSSDSTGGQAYRPNLNFNTTSGSVYKIVFTPISITGTFNPYINLSGSGDLPTFDASSTATMYFIGNGSQIALNTKSNGGSYTATFTYSLKEVLQSADLSDTYPAIIDVNEPVLGVELVTNGSFDSDSSWIKGTGWTIGSGVATSDSSAQSGTSYLESASFTALDTSTTYKLSFRRVQTNTGSLRFLAMGSGDTVVIDYNTTTTGTDEVVYFKPNGANTSIWITSLDGNFSGSVDNISLKEVNGNVGTMTNQDSADLVYSSVLPDQSFLATGVNSAYNFIDLDGGDQYIDCGDIDTSGNFTFSCWFNADSVVGS